FVGDKFEGNDEVCHYNRCSCRDQCCSNYIVYWHEFCIVCGTSWRCSTDVPEEITNFLIPHHCDMTSVKRRQWYEIKQSQEIVQRSEHREKGRPQVCFDQLAADS